MTQIILKRVLLSASFFHRLPQKLARSHSNTVSGKPRLLTLLMLQGSPVLLYGLTPMMSTVVHPIGCDSNMICVIWAVTWASGI